MIRQVAWFFFTVTLFFLFDVFALRFLPGLPSFFVFFLFCMGSLLCCAVQDDIPTIFGGDDSWTAEEAVRAWRQMERFALMSILCFLLGLLGAWMLPSNVQFGIAFGATDGLLGLAVTRSLIARDDGLLA